jgi:hypothetical protein
MSRPSLDRRRWHLLVAMDAEMRRNPALDYHGAARLVARSKAGEAEREASGVDNPKSVDNPKTFRRALRQLWKKHGHKLQRPTLTPWSLMTPENVAVMRRAFPVLSRTDELMRVMGPQLWQLAPPLSPMQKLLGASAVNNPILRAMAARRRPPE